MEEADYWPFFPGALHFARLISNFSFSSSVIAAVRLSPTYDGRMGRLTLVGASVGASMGFKERGGGAGRLMA